MCHDVVVRCDYHYHNCDRPHDVVVRMKRPMKSKGQKRGFSLCLDISLL